MGSNNIINDYIAGALGGAAGLVIGHPFDTTKVQLQTKQTSAAYAGTIDAMKHIKHHGWVQGFFRGMGFPLASYGVVNSVFFGVYGHTLRTMKGDAVERRPTYGEAFTAGCVGGFFQLFVACPVDVIKVVLQAQISKTSEQTAAGGRGFRGPVECVRHLYRSGGLRGCYRAFWIQMSRDVPASGIYFLVYEALTDALHERGLCDSRSVGASLLGGGVAGVSSWMAIMPLDVVKSQLQADYRGERYSLQPLGRAGRAARAVYTAKGIAGFFAGSGVTAVRAFLVNAVTLLVYTQSMKALNAFTPTERNH